MRRGAFACLGTAAGLLLLLGGPASVASAQIFPSDRILELETVASGLAAPLGVTHAGDGSGRLFVYEQDVGTTSSATNWASRPDVTGGGAAPTGNPAASPTSTTRAAGANDRSQCSMANLREKNGAIVPATGRRPRGIWLR